MSDLRINPALLPSPIIQSTPALALPEQTGASFAAVLGNAIQEVNDLQAQAGEEVGRVLTGEINDIHTAMIAMQKADISFQMMMQVRNKIVSAYQEIMKMQV